MGRFTAFCCSQCNCELTDFLETLPESALEWCAEVEAVPAGRYVVVQQDWTYAEFVTGKCTRSKYVGHDAGIIAFHSRDYLLNTSDVKHLIMDGASTGCCGYQPRGEANATCPNGHPIGTLHNDCWAAFVFRLHYACVQIVDD